MHGFSFTPILMYLAFVAAVFVFALLAPLPKDTGKLARYAVCLLAILFGFHLVTDGLYKKPTLFAITVVALFAGVSIKALYQSFKSKKK